MYSFKYNQEDASLYNILYYCQGSACLGGFSAHHQELKNCTNSIGCIPSLLAVTASVGEFLVLLESGLQTCVTYTSAECTVNKLLMMGRGTVRNV